MNELVDQQRKSLRLEVPKAQRAVSKATLEHNVLVEEYHVQKRELARASEPPPLDMENETLILQLESQIRELGDSKSRIQSQLTQAELNRTACMLKRKGGGKGQKTALADARAKYSETLRRLTESKNRKLTIEARAKLTINQCRVIEFSSVPLTDELVTWPDDEPVAQEQPQKVEEALAPPPAEDAAPTIAALPTDGEPTQEAFNGDQWNNQNP